MAFFKKLISLCLLAAVLAVLFIGLAIAYVEYTWPNNIALLKTVQLQVPLQIYTKDGKLMASFGEKKRIPIPYEKIPKPLIDAILATEDQRFFSHPGIDAAGLVRASIRLLLTGKTLEGGSTITMQVARSFYLTPKKTFSRKLREMFLAVKIESTLSKEKILELYLNKVFFGNRAYGVGAAAEVYFGKALDELSIDEIALIAGLPQAPSALNPLANKEASKKRRNHVLKRMLEVGAIDEATYQSAIRAPIRARLHNLSTEIKAPFVAEIAREQLFKMYGEQIYTNGYRVYTTVNSSMQETANKSVQDQLLNYDQRHGYRGAEANLGLPDLERIDEYSKKLAHSPILGGLEPAIVFEIHDRSIIVLNANGEFLTIPWEGLSWARKQINADYLGALPRNPNQIVQLGDLVRVQKTPSGLKLAQLPKAEAAFVAINPQNGAILALVGGFDYYYKQFNNIISANRQPGSSFKPFIYAAALNKGYTLATLINDAPIVVENPYDHSLWQPKNANHRFRGPTRMREALTHSINTVSIRLLDLVGIQYAMNYLKQFNFRKESIPPVLALALGTGQIRPIELAAAYCTFANNGYLISPYLIDHVQDSNGNVIYQAYPQQACPTCEGNKPPLNVAPRIISAENAFLINSALHDVIQYGTASSVEHELNRRDLAGKTGTTQDQVDAWFVGYNQDIVAAAWVGFTTGQQSLHEYGNKAALPIWIQFMKVVLKNRPDPGLPVPPGIVNLRVDPQTGRRASEENPMAIDEYFMKSALPSSSNSQGDSVEDAEDIEDLF